MQVKQIRQFLDSFFMITQVPVMWISANNRSVFVGSQSWQPLCEQSLEAIRKQLNTTATYHYYAGDHGESYLWTGLRNHGEILIGPFINATNAHFDSEQTSQQSRPANQQDPISITSQFDYFSGTNNGLLPTVISQMQLTASAQLLSGALLSAKITRQLTDGLTSQFSSAPVKDTQSTVQHKLTVDETLAKPRASYQAERKFYATIRAGKVDQVIATFQQFANSGATGLVVAGNQLRNEKDLAIAATTLATRAAIQGGLLPEIAYEISDHAIQMIEQQLRVNDVIGILMTQLVQFAKEVQQTHQHHYSTIVNTMTAMVYAHRATGIQLETVAQELNKSVGYLASRFLRETGRSFMTYQTQIRLAFAQAQLSQTSGTITSIATLMAFDDPSYFTKWFKRISGKTPSQYRQSINYQ